jgi:hypothetical protein
MGYKMSTLEAPWWASVSEFGSSMADRLTETAGIIAQAKLAETMGKYTNPRQTLAEKDASASQDKQAAAAVVKGKDSDGTTLTSQKVNLSGMSAKLSTVKKVGYGSAAALILLLGFKVMAK